MSNKINGDAHQCIRTTIHVGEEEVGTMSVCMHARNVLDECNLQAATTGTIDGIIAEYVTEYVANNMHCTTSLDDITALRKKILNNTSKENLNL